MPPDARGRVDVCMLVRNASPTDARVHRAALTLVEGGLSVAVVSLRHTDPLNHRRAAWYRSERLNVSGGRLSAKLRYHGGVLATLFRLRPQVVHCHDTDTLLSGFVAARTLGARVVYDAHELWLERTPPAHGWRWHQRLKERAIERAMIPRCDAVITVSRGVAMRLAQRYGIAMPTVIHNVPRSTAPSRRRDLHGKVGHHGPLLLYIGAVLPGRGLGAVVNAIVDLHDWALVLLGNHEHSYHGELMAQARALGVAHRIHTLDPVPPDEILDWAQTAQVGVCTIEPISESYRLSLPNKLFEYAFAGVPVLTSDLPEIADMVQRYHLGACCALTPTAIATTVRGLNSNVVGNAPQRERLVRELGWPRQAQKLWRVYHGLGFSPRA